MYVVAEEEQFLVALVPPAAGGEHVAVFPEIDFRAEVGPGCFGVIVQQGGPDEDRIREHVDVAHEREQAEGVGIGSVVALDDLAVLADHGRAAPEDGDTVLGVVVEDAGAQDIVALVAQLHHAAAELRQVLVDQVVQRLAGQHGLALHQLDVAVAIDQLVIHAPEGGVADEIGAVVQECGGNGLARHPAVRLHLLEVLGVQQAYQRIRLPGSGLGGQRQRADQQDRAENQSFLTFSDHPFLEKSQSPNRGSMMM